MAKRSAKPPEPGMGSRRDLEYSALVEVGKALTSTVDLKEILALIMKQVSEVLKPRNWSLLLLDELTDELYFEIAVSPAADQLKYIRLKRGEGIAGWVAQHGEPLLISDVSSDERFAPKVDEATEFTTKSIVAVPLKYRNKVLGVVELINNMDEATFTEGDLTLLTAIADFAAIGIENARNFDRIQQLVITDDLTGLYNAGYLLDFLDFEIERARRYKTPLSLVFVDLDHFKHVNDTHGHLVGSRLLIEVAGIIRNKIRKSDMAVRYGGDEFVLVLPNTPKKGAAILAENLRVAIKSSLLLREQGYDIKITGSFGLASYPEDADSKLNLIKLADQAMYRVKDMSRDAVLSA